MAHTVMAYIDRNGLYWFGLHCYVPYCYGPYCYGPYCYGLYGYGLYSYLVMAYMAMTADGHEVAGDLPTLLQAAVPGHHIVMAHIVTALFSYGRRRSSDTSTSSCTGPLYSYGPCSYGLYNHGRCRSSDTSTSSCTRPSRPIASSS